MTLLVHLLGPAHISRDGQPIAIHGHRPLALLAYLLVSGEAHSRQHLVDLLFDNADDPRASLRWTLSKLRHDIGPEHIRSDRQEIAFNFESDYWLDVTSFEAGELALYQGDFLEGLHVRDAYRFEDWAFYQRERLRGDYERALTGQLEAYERQGDDDRVVETAHHLLRLDDLREDWHRALMRGYARLGNREAALTQYAQCQRVLAAELGVEPEAETTALFEQIQTGALEATQAAAVPPPHIAIKLPAFLEEKREEAKRPVFVARQQELAQLAEHLEVVLQDQGRVVFVTGEAGEGKTALLAEFVRRAQAAHPDLIAVGGHCSAYTGAGDPYLPFRDVMGMLSGDVEQVWAAGTITREGARRLWHLMPHTIQALVDQGRDLVDVFVTGAALVNRVSGSASGGAGWLARLRRLAERKRPGPGDLEQRQLFEQYGQVLRALAGRAPLLLALDDLQWADTASTNLLFHLGRRLAGSRIMILGAYRPSEVALGRQVPAGLEKETKHPLEPVITELKRLFGDIQIDLGQMAPAEGREFVDAFLDTEPNRLGEGFRQALFMQTRGHPLFTVQLLRDMQERGVLVQDQAGRWTEGSSLAWEVLPARVEAVIEGRIGRLKDELREMLTVASVEGEDFSAQVVASVQDVNERHLLHQLSQELERRHKLVREEGEVAVGHRRLSRYRFCHVLVQQYLYNGLSPGERRLLHSQIAALLEELYTGRTHQVTVKLARHYAEAGEDQKAVDYLLQAGDQARGLYAHQEAIDHYQGALAFLKERGDYGRAARTQMKLGLTYHTAFQFQQARRAYQEGFALWQRAGEMEPAASQSAPHALRVNWEDPLTLDPTRAFRGPSHTVIHHLFSGLLEQRSELDVVPDVARSWEVSEGGRRYVFHLRDDVRWSDKVPVTARDFEYAWKRVLDPAAGWPYASVLYALKGARAFHQGQAGREDVGVRAVDELTLAVDLEEPTGYFLHLLTHPNSYPVPQHAVATHGEAWTEVENIVTNGPFRLEAWNRSQSIRLAYSPTYHGQFSGNLERVELSCQSDGATAGLEMLEKYEANDLDVFDDEVSLIPRAAMDRARLRHAPEYFTGPNLLTWYAGFNVSQPPFDDRRVRRAFVLATDRETLADVVLRGYDSPATGGLVPPGMPGHSPGIGLPYDPETARHLLVKVGYADARGFPTIELLTVLRHVPVCEALQAQWGETLGVDVRYQVMEATALRSRLESQPPHIYVWNWAADYPDPDNFLRANPFRRSTRWRNETYDRLVTEARGVMDQEERMRLYRQAERILVDEAPIVPLCYIRFHLLVKPWVTNFPVSAIRSAFLKDVIIKPH